MTIPHRFSTTIDIAAPPERVWAVMSDVERWSEWTTTVTSIRRSDAGPLRVGSVAWIRQPGLPPSRWRVTALEPGRSFTWVTGAPGVLSRARHVVEPSGPGARATLSIAYEGLFGGLLAWLTRGINDKYLAIEAAGLKRRSEAG